MLWLTIIIAVSLIGSLIYINRRLSENTRDLEAREAQVAKLRQRAGQVEDLIRSWSRSSNERALTRELYQVALEILDGISAIDPTQAFAANEQQRLLPLMESLAQDDGNQSCVTALGSTNDVARLQNDLKEIKRLLHTRSSSELLTDAQYQGFCREIDWVHSQVALDTCLSLARTSLAENRADQAEQLLLQARIALDAGDESDSRFTPYSETLDGLIQQLPPRVASAE